MGVTWAPEAEAAASALLAALAARGHDNVVAISDVEAVEVLAWGIADVAGYEDVTVCVVEPDAAVVAVVDVGGVTVERIDRSVLGADATELTAAAVAIWEPDVRQPEAIFVLGSDDLDPIVSELTAASEVPVISAAEADLAMARGAALASATAVDTLDAQAASVGLFRNSTTGALTSVLVAAVVTFVVSVSAAVGLQAVPDESVQRGVVDAADRAIPAAPPPSVAQAAPVTPPARAAAHPGHGPAEGRWRPSRCSRRLPPKPFRTPPAAAPVEPAPVYQPPAPVDVPPAPAYVLPAPAYVPPPPPVTSRRRHTSRLLRRPSRGFVIGSSRRSRSSTGSTSRSTRGIVLPLRLDRRAGAGGQQFRVACSRSASSMFGVVASRRGAVAATLSAGGESEQHVGEDCRPRVERGVAAGKLDELGIESARERPPRPLGYHDEIVAADHRRRWYGRKFAQRKR